MEYSAQKTGLLEDLTANSVLSKLLLRIIPQNEAVSYAHHNHMSVFSYALASLTFTLAVRDTRHINLLRDRLHPTIQRVLRDVFEQEVEIIYVTHDEWRDRHR